MQSRRAAGDAHNFVRDEEADAAVQAALDALANKNKPQ
jgi:hypothetical protein